MCAANNVINIKNAAVEAWQCVVCVVELDISLPKIIRLVDWYRGYGATTLCAPPLIPPVNPRGAPRQAT